VHDSMSTGSHPHRCPFCEVHEHDSAHCLFDAGFLSEGLLEMLHRLTTELPDTFSPTSLVDAPTSAAAWR
jgi:hypothetical protein